jgi:hypothetical protein
MKNAVFWDVSPCGSCKNRVSEERSAAMIRVTGIGVRKNVSSNCELGNEPSASIQCWETLE